MTVCIAAIQNGHWGTKGPGIDPSLILVSDRRLSFGGGMFSQDGTAVKLRYIHQDWYVMYAGDASQAQPLLDSMHEALNGLKPNTRAEVVQLCGAAYKAERRKMIETEILPDFNIDTYRQYLALERRKPKSFREIDAKVREAEEDWELLFAGFDRDRHPHVFSVFGRGKVRYLTPTHFGAIGTGSTAASLWLCAQPYSADGPVGEKLMTVLCAKFFSEGAGDVGSETLAVVVRPRVRAVFPIGDVRIGQIRKVWDDHPKTPLFGSDVVTEDLQASLKAHKEYMGKYRWVTRGGQRIVVERKPRKPRTTG